MAWIWWEELDLSSLTYPAFLAYFFDRPIVGSADERYYLFRKGIDNFYAYDPATVASHVRDMCRDWANLTKIYSDDQLNQGLWAVFGVAISCERFCLDPQVDISLRTDAIESMYIPFRDGAMHRTVEYVKDSFYSMWWDAILFNTFYEDDWKTGYSRSRDYRALTDDRKLMGDAILRTLVKILALDHQGCQWCALHGLGHLNHPSGGEIVQAYLDAHRSELSEIDILWIEQCRDGRCM